MSSVIEKTLSELNCSFLSGYAFKSSDYVEMGIPLIKIGNIQNKIVTLYFNDSCISASSLDDKTSKYFLSDDDILIAMTGQGSVGRVGKLKLETDCTALLNQRVGKFICDEKQLNKNYLYYVLTSEKYQEFLFNTGSGSGQPNLSPDLILQTPIPYFEYKEQKAIAAVLSSLDDKIDLLHRQNQTLEAMAETLFRQWFLEEAEEVWEVVTLDDVISVKGGTTPSTKEPAYWDGDVYWTSPRDLSNHNSVFLFNTERKITQLGLSKIGSGLMPVGTILLSSRAPIGYLAIADIPVAINQGYIAIVCDKILSNYFMYLWCKINMDEIKNAGNGSTFEEISKSNFKALSITIPPKQKLELFDKTIEPVFNKIRNNKLYLRDLEQLRDNLLPKLMSGEVRIK
jgi:type I restriction enzyme S subunit